MEENVEERSPGGDPLWGTVDYKFERVKINTPFFNFMDFIVNFLDFAYDKVRTLAYASIRQQYVSIRQHTSAYVSNTSAYVSIRQQYVSIRQHTSAYVSNTSAYVSIRQHAYAVDFRFNFLDFAYDKVLLYAEVC
jgi:hypothetical protein